MAFLYKAHPFLHQDPSLGPFQRPDWTLKLQFEDWSEYRIHHWMGMIDMIDMIGWWNVIDGLKDVGWSSKAIPKLIPNQARTFMQSRDFVWKAFLSFPANKKVTHPQLDRLVLNRPQIRQTPQFQNWNKNYSNCKLFHYQPRHQLFFPCCFSEQKNKTCLFLCVSFLFSKHVVLGVNNSSPHAHGFGLNQTTNPTGNGLFFFWFGRCFGCRTGKTHGTEGSEKTLFWWDLVTRRNF